MIIATGGESEKLEIHNTLNKMMFYQRAYKQSHNFPLLVKVDRF